RLPITMSKFSLDCLRPILHPFFLPWSLPIKLALLKIAMPLMLPWLCVTFLVTLLTRLSLPIALWMVRSSSLIKKKLTTESSHSYLSAVLTKFGFPPLVQHAFAVTYTNTSAFFMDDGHPVGPVSVACGVRQGDS